MDYDENDFQNQNHHLGGEGNNKFAPVLNPYALPKFEFDDSLQGHVRFDSLVESEVFLGIGSNEDNRWIEDFSRGSCGIDFSKSSADQCSISRCNNVWSEATSSESVEMLLKSVGVGPEEAIRRRDIAEVPDASDDLGCSTKKMEPNVSHDATLPKLGDIGDLQPSFSPEDSSRLKNDVEMNQTHEVSLQCDHGESIENNASNLDLDTGEKLGSLAEGYLCDGEACIDVSRRDVSDLVTDSVNNGAVEDITCSEVKVDHALTDRDSIIVDDNKSLEGPDPTNDASVKDENDLQQSSILLGGELLALENKNKVNNENSDGDKQRNMDGDEINQQKSNINAVESMNSHLDEAAFLGSNEEGIMEENTGRTIVNETDQGRTYQDVPIKGASIIDQSNETVHMESPVILETDKEIDGHPMEVVSSEQADDSSLQRDHVDEKYKPVDDQLVSGDLEGNTVASLYSVDDNAGKGDADRGMTCHSANIQIETVAADSMGSSKVDSNVENQVLSSAQAGTTETELVNGQDDAPNPDSASVHEGDSTMLLPGSSNNDSAIGIPVITDKGFMVPPSFSQSGNNEDVIDDHKVVHKLAEVVLPSLSEPVEAASHASNEQSLDTIIPEQIGNLQSLYESQTAEAQVSHECNNTIEVAENLVDVTSKGDCCAGDTIIAGKPGVPTPQEKSETEPSGDAARALESSLVLTGPLPGNQDVSDVPEVERDHHDSYKTNPDTRIANGNGNLSASGEEKGKSENFPVQEVGVSGAEAQDVKDGPYVPDPKEIDASKIEKSSSLQIAETSPSTSGPLQTGSRFQHSVKQGNHQVDDKENRSSKGTPDRKPRKRSVKSAGRESAKKGNLVKDARPVKQAELPGKSSSVSLGPSRIYQVVQPNQILRHGEMEGLGTKPFGALTTPPSSLPDLNSSAFPSMVFQQPFNDLQQVQLRAQILVYGSLISRLAPEELHMISAFGGPDGGRSVWEKAWQTCKARVSGQVPQPVNSETPTSSQSVDPASDPTSKQTKVTPPPTGRSSTIGTPTFNINPMIPVSSPLWNLSTPSVDVLQSSSLPRGAVMDYQPAFPQLAPHQNQPVINCAGHSTTWMSQTPFRGPWATSPQIPALSTSIHFPSFLTEPVQLTPVKESSLALSSGMKHAPPSSSQSGVHPSATAGASPSLDLAKVIVQSGQPSADPKSKKRKKGLPTEDQSRITLASQSDCEKLSIPAAASSLKTSATATMPARFLSKCITPESNVVTSPAPSITPVKEADLGTKKPILAIGEVKEARQQAEAAAALAAAAVSHGQEVWNELDENKISGSISVSEAKIASAAVAIAAAAAIAKAAAMAANLASNAALQAKAMADEALTAGDCSNPNVGESNSRVDGGMHSSSSIILVAKEAARRRVEAASAAAVRAENLDVIVKAAEIAAEAILQAGEIVAMGDPLSMGKLAEAGPEGFWKLPQFYSDQASKVHDANVEQANNDDLVAGSIGSKKSSEGPPDNGVAHLNQHVLPSASIEILRNPMKDKVSLIVGISGTVSPGDKVQMGQKLPTTSDTAPEITESQHGLRSLNVGDWEESNKAAGAKRDNVIQEGSRAEVFKDGAWFSADVMSLEDGKAYVSYNELPSSKGSGKLQEWVEIGGVGDRAPMIRFPHPMTAVQFDGSKKRRRAAIGSLTCSVGDKVDAWIQDRWWEGVVTDKSKKDETSVTVQLPALGETSVVKAWHLRPSLIWNGGEWIEWSSREDDQSHDKGDTPDGKRAKLGSSRKQAKGKDKAAKTLEVPHSGKPEGSKLLDLSAKERVFNIGKSNTDEGKPDSHRTIRSGLRKQGPGVIFGVPKPGKKRKFMEVSKHYVVGQSNDKAPVNDSVKLANYLMPRGTGPRGLRNAPRSDVKEDEAAELKTKAPATVKSRGLSGRTASQKYSSKISVSAPGDASVADHIGKMKDSSGHVGKHNHEGAGQFSSSEVAIAGPISFSFGASSDATVSKISAPKSDSVNKKKPAPTGEKLAQMEEDKIINSNSQVEPRRSNRRIQPTSRLLEGLQSSSITLKVPSSLHDKGHSTHGGAKGKNHG